VNKKKIRFITNPFSGTKTKANLNRLIDQHLDLDQFEYEIAYTEGPDHATTLAAEAVKLGYWAVVSVGGDGTINEISKALVHTKTILGVIPFGSGNGFAYHLGLKRDVSAAIIAINIGKTEQIDTAMANEIFFVNVAGIGLDARVAYMTKQNRFRGFLPYFLTTIKESFRFSFIDFKITTDDKQWQEKYAMVVIANGSYYGYNFAIAPLAVLNDGLLDVLLFKKAPIYKYISLVPLMLTKNLIKSPLITYLRLPSIVLENETLDYFHADGEGMKQESNKMTFQVHPKSLTIFIK